MKFGRGEAGKKLYHARIKKLCSPAKFWKIKLYDRIGFLKRPAKMWNFFSRAKACSTLNQTLKNNRFERFCSTVKIFFRICESEFASSCQDVSSRPACRRTRTWRGCDSRAATKINFVPCLVCRGIRLQSFKREKITKFNSPFEGGAVRGDVPLMCRCLEKGTSPFTAWSPLDEGGITAVLSKDYRY